MTEHPNGGGEERLAPVTPLFPGSVAPEVGVTPGVGPAANIAAVGGRVRPAEARRAAVDRSPSIVDEGEERRANERAVAEKALLRKLRGRQLSEREARALVASGDLPSEDVDELIGDFRARGYLDDERLAEQLVHAATSRRGQGRQAIARSMAQRGVPRDVVDDALAQLPDDDTERALDFARGKARSLSSLDRQTALRRLHGQLARRGFSGAVALSAARTALDDVAGLGGSSGVRFE